MKEWQRAGGKDERLRADCVAFASAVIGRWREKAYPFRASAEEGPLQEMICADNTNVFFADPDAPPVPQATVPDF